MTNPWQPGTTYPPGALARPRATPPVVTPAIPNPDFETGDWTGWTQVPSWHLSQSAHYSGSWSLQLDANAGTAQDVVSDNKVPVNVGQVINAQLMVQQGAASSGDAGAVIKMVWYDAAGTEVSSRSQGTDVHSGSGGHWKASSGRFVAPAGAAQAAVAIGGWNNSNDLLWVDLVTWTYAYAGPPPGLVYKAVQAAPGKSGSTEPAWPPVLGQTVVDNQVTWEAVIATRLVWEAIPLLKSASTEPAWPDDVDAQVRDNTINWEAVSRRIDDVNCPHSKIIAIAANKVFKGDGDVAPFCATNNANDWTSPQDAGYLPTGLQSVGETECTALAIYRGNLAAFSASGLQLWQVDPDPAKMVFLDAVDGVGTHVSRGHATVQNDLYFLSPLGVRSVSVSAGTGSLDAGDIGTPIDDLVQKDMASFAGVPLGIYLPSSGQYWLILGDHAWVFCYSPTAQIAAWSRYTFAWTVTDACVRNGDLYLRDSNNRVLKMDTTAEQQGRPIQDAGENFDVEVRWPYEDFGAAGGNLYMLGCDVLYQEKVSPAPPDLPWRRVAELFIAAGALPPDGSTVTGDMLTAVPAMLGPAVAPYVMRSKITIADATSLGGSVHLRGFRCFSDINSDAFGDASIQVNAVPFSVFEQSEPLGDGSTYSREIQFSLLGIAGTAPDAIIVVVTDLSGNVLTTTPCAKGSDLPGGAYYQQVSDPDPAPTSYGYTIFDGLTPGETYFLEIKTP